MSIEQIHHHIKLVIQYDGTNFAGWQVQKKGTTIQGLLEDALLSVTGEQLRITAAARTDAGVHAFEQVAVFNTLSRLEPGVFLRALNAQLDRDIRIISAEYCQPDFHPRYDAKNKTYTYLISQKGVYSSFLERYSWSMPYTLDTCAMQKAAQHLIGTYDFSSFRASGCSSRHPVRTVSSLEVCRSSSVEFISFSFNSPVVKITMQANAFLRHMARNIVGTLVDIGKGKYPPSMMKEILESKDRRQAGRTAPARGLFLEKIEY